MGRGGPRRPVPWSGARRPPRGSSAVRQTGGRRSAKVHGPRPLPQGRAAGSVSALCGGGPGDEVNSAPPALGVEPAPQALTKPRWRTWHCVAIGLSFANLASFQRWSPMLGYSDKDAYFMKLPPAPAEYWAAIV